MRDDAASRILTSAIDGRMTDLRYRQHQLRALHAWIAHHAADACKAMQKDDNYTENEAEAVLTAVLTEIRTQYDSLDLKKELRDEYSLKRGQDSLRGRAYGAVYIIPEPHTLLFSVVSALCAAVVAGNCCVVEVRSCN